MIDYDYTYNNDYQVCEEIIVEEVPSSQDLVYQMGENIMTVVGGFAEAKSDQKEIEETMGISNQVTYSRSKDED